MRQALVSALLEHTSDPAMCLLTGDLGFMALEPLRDALGDRFINAGVSEQNMLSVAAGMARSGMRPWVYSIAPFCYARPFEQIRNDVALHDLPVRIIANGGGYGYGVQGPSHHGIEDCAVMGCLQNMRVHVPAFGDDLGPLIAALTRDGRPGYLRLGRDERPEGVQPPPHAPFRLLHHGAAGLILALGPLAGVCWNALLRLPEEKRPELWCCCEMPRDAGDYPTELLRRAADAPWALVAEEHVATGGLGANFALALLESGFRPQRFVHRHALGYPGKRYGSQQYHRAECGLDVESIGACILELGRPS